MNETTYSTWWNAFYRILSFCQSPFLHSLSISDAIAISLSCFILLYCLALFGRFALSFSSRVIINQQFTTPFSRVCSLYGTETNLDDICWPQFALEDDIPFSDFVQRLEEIFEAKRIPYSKKFACFRRCLTRLNPTLIQTSRALDIRDYDTAVSKLRPLLFVPDAIRSANIKAQYASIQQSRSQSLQEYHQNFSKLNSTHSLPNQRSLQLFYDHLSSPIRVHVAYFFVISLENDDPVSVFYDRITKFLQLLPLPSAPAATISSPSHSSKPRPLCTHCGKNHPSDRCYKAYPHLRPINNTNHINTINTINSGNGSQTSLNKAMCPKYSSPVVNVNGDTAQTLGTIHLEFNKVWSREIAVSTRRSDQAAADDSSPILGVKSPWYGALATSRQKQQTSSCIIPR
ncbi:hypothetical protein B0O80DRAFT_501422 [Mortierella sp. GBAus27b]|nr:hypothetical protein B0O80DRAFT_501422 [Mortierella sp. GBAus27b]